MAPLGETIAVIDKSGKVVSTSKHLFGVFSQAKNAYRERKAQFQSERNAKIAEREALRALENYHIDENHYIEDARSVASSQRSRSRHHSGRSRHHREGSLYEEDMQWQVSRGDPYSPRPGEMVRRHTHDVVIREPERPVTNRSKSDAQVDMDLAYGEFHPSALEQPHPDQQLQRIEDPELNGLVNRAQWLLEEAECVQHTATATISHLQKNPDAMAAVALTLAEISNVVTKAAPSALTALKAVAPSIFALLASPQFLIAGGVALGVTIVMFGGFKIVKQLQAATTNNAIKAPAAPEAQPEPEIEDMMEFNTECLSTVEMWRRGVADVEAHSVGTSVDGEFITPTAAAMSGIDVTTARMSRDPRFKFDDDEKSMASSRRSHRSRAHRGSSRADHRPESYAPSRAPSKMFSKAPSKAPPRAPTRVSSRAPSEAPSRAESRYSDKEGKPKEKPKRSSRLRLMFTA
ncbi:hypothetical protein BO71DRAFT_60555 [Aspergillus ellipticus CBS 707.79]|uniref:Uncharacterized protein n=1 Tax=Aspergillus ellipticus CBS 707.79 TaxID=1448320 RepID=A0A319D0Q4_9EURO|nr:hypothetical protein BO71DRAFT_60555 [Aspergillus ellipticus CBS 707.79]